VSCCNRPWRSLTKMKILSQMVNQFQARHQRLPTQILIDPPALVVLTKRRSVSPTWRGIPVKCQEIHADLQKGTVNGLGVVILGGELRGIDLSL